MAKLYWAMEKDSEEWFGPHASDREALSFARKFFGPDIPSHVWVAPVDAETDDDDKFWAELASWVLLSLDDAVEQMVEGGWLDPEDPDLPTNASDTRGDLARALRDVLGPRPEWRTVDTSKAERVEL